MLYGSPAWDVVNDSTDRIGIRTLTISKLWQAKQWLANTVDPQLDANYPAAIPPVSGGVLLIGQETRKFGGAFKTFWTFEGINGNGVSVTFKGRSNSLDYQFDPGFSQVSIQLFPGFADLLAQYQGQSTGDSVLWPQILSNSSGGTGLGADNNAGQTNPMFGVQDFLRLEGTYSFRYASLTPPTGAGVGYIASSLPGKPPVFPPADGTDGRNWLMAPTPYKRRGTIYDITEIYWLSGPGGWPTPIYGGGSGGDSNNFGFGLAPFANEQSASSDFNLFPSQ